MYKQYSPDQNARRISLIYCCLFGSFRKFFIVYWDGIIGLFDFRKSALKSKMVFKGRHIIAAPNLHTQGVKCPIYSYIFLYLEDSPIYSYIWKTVVYIPIFKGKQKMLNSYLKQMMLISNMERCKFVILQHLLSNSHNYASYRQRLDRDKEEKERQMKQWELVKAEKKKTRKRKEKHLC